MDLSRKGKQGQELRESLPYLAALQPLNPFALLMFWFDLEFCPVEDRIVIQPTEYIFAHKELITSLESKLGEHQAKRRICPICYMAKFGLL